MKHVFKTSAFKFLSIIVAVCACVALLAFLGFNADGADTYAEGTRICYAVENESDEIAELSLKVSENKSNDTVGVASTTSSAASGQKNSLSTKTVLIILCAGVALVTLMAILVLILAIKNSKGAGGEKDEDGFYDDYIGEY